MGDDDFNAGELAGRAVGELADGPGDAVTVDEEVAELAGGGDGGDGGGEDGEDGGSLLHSFLFAPERGPTQPTFVDAGLGPDPALVLDGTTDWLLDVIGGDSADDLEDSLGPIGKIGLGAGRMLSRATDDGDAGDAGDAGDDAGELDEDAPAKTEAVV